MPDGETLTPTDAELLAATSRGEGAAFETLVARHGGWLHRYARALAPADADELLQDALVDAWRGAGSFAGSESAKGWLVTIARHAHRRRFRRRAGEPAVFDPVDSIDDLGRAAGWGGGSPYAELERTLTREAIAAGLDGLDADEREAVVLRDLEGFAGDEAARLVGVTMAAFKSRLHRGRLHLAARLRRRHDGRS